MSRTPRIVSNLPEHREIVVQRAHHRDRISAAGTVVHPHAGIGFCLAGTARFWMGRDYQLSRGDVVIVPEGAPHFGHDVRDVEQIGLVLCPHCMRSEWGDALRDLFSYVRRGGAAVRKLGEQLDDVVELLERLETELASRKEHHARMVDGLMLQLAVELERARPTAVASGAAGSSIVVTKALDYITRHAPDAISLSDVAQHVGRSPAHLATVVKDETGQTVVEWITNARMARARHLLSTTDETVAAISESVGYASPSHFHRTFRRVSGATPGEWRTAHRTSHS